MMKFNIVRPANEQRTLVFKNSYLPEYPAHFPVELVMLFPKRQIALVKIMFDNISPKEIFVNYHYLSAIYNYTSEQYYIQRELILHDHLIAAQAQDLFISYLEDLTIPFLPEQSSYERNRCFLTCHQLNRNEVHKQLAYCWQRLMTENTIFHTISKNRMFVYQFCHNSKRQLLMRHNYSILEQSFVFGHDYMKQRARLAFYYYSLVYDINYVDNSVIIIKVEQLIMIDLNKLKTTHLPQIFNEVKQSYDGSSILQQFQYLIRFLIPFSILCKAHLTSNPFKAYLCLSRFFFSFFHSKFVQLRDFITQQCDIKTVMYQQQHHGIAQELINCFEHVNLQFFSEDSRNVLHVDGIQVLLVDNKFQLSSNTTQLMQPARIDTLNLVSNFSLQFVVSEYLQLQRIFTKRQIEYLDQVSTSLCVLDDQLENGTSGILFSPNIYYKVEQLSAFFTDFISILFLFVDDLNVILENQISFLDQFKQLEFYQILNNKYTLLDYQKCLSVTEMLSFLDIIKIDIDSLNNISETLIVSLFVIDIKDVKTLFLSRLAQQKEELIKLLDQSVRYYMRQIHDNLNNKNDLISQKININTFKIAQKVKLEIPKEIVSQQIDQFLSIFAGLSESYYLEYEHVVLQYLQFIKLNNRQNELIQKYIDQISFLEIGYLKQLLELTINLKQIVCQCLSEKSEESQNIRNIFYSLSKNSFITESKKMDIQLDLSFYLLQFYNSRNFDLFDNVYVARFISGIQYLSFNHMSVEDFDFQQLVLFDWYQLILSLQFNSHDSDLFQQINHEAQTKELQLVISSIKIAQFPFIMEQLVEISFDQLDIISVLDFFTKIKQIIYDLQQITLMNILVTNIQDCINKFSIFLQICQTTKVFNKDSQSFNDMFKHLFKKQFIPSDSSQKINTATLDKLNYVSLVDYCTDEEWLLQSIQAYVQQQMRYRYLLKQIQDQFAQLTVHQYPVNSLTNLSFEEIELKFVVTKGLYLQLVKDFLYDEQSITIINTIRLIEQLLFQGYKFLLNHAVLQNYIMFISNYSRNSYVQINEQNILVSIISVNKWQAYEQAKNNYLELTYVLLRDMLNYSQAALIPQILYIQQVFINKMSSIIQEISNYPFNYVINYYRIQFVQTTEIIIPNYQNQYYPLLALNGFRLQNDFQPTILDDRINTVAIQQMIEQNQLFTNFSRIKILRSNKGYMISSIISQQEQLYFISNIPIPQYTSLIYDALYTHTGPSLLKQIQDNNTKMQQIISSLFQELERSNMVQSKLYLGLVLEQCLSLSIIIYLSICLFQNTNQEQSILDKIDQLQSLIKNLIIQKDQQFKTKLEALKQYLNLCQEVLQQHLTNVYITFKFLGNKLCYTTIDGTGITECCFFWPGQIIEKQINSLFYRQFSNILLNDQKNISSLVVINYNSMQFLSQLKYLYETFIQKKVMIFEVKEDTFYMLFSRIQLCLKLNIKLIILGLETLNDDQIQMIGNVCYQVFSQKVDFSKIYYPYVFNDVNQTLIRLKSDNQYLIDTNSLVFIYEITHPIVNSNIIRIQSFLQYCQLFTLFNEECRHKQQFLDETEQMIIKNFQLTTKQECQYAEIQKQCLLKKLQFTTQLQQLSSSQFELIVLFNYFIRSKQQISIMILQNVFCFLKYVLEFLPSMNIHILVIDNFQNDDNQFPHFTSLSCQYIIFIIIQNNKELIQLHNQYTKLISDFPNIQTVFISQNQINVDVLSNYLCIQQDYVFYLDKIPLFKQLQLTESYYSITLAQKRSKFTYLLFQNTYKYFFDYISNIAKITNMWILDLLHECCISYFIQCNIIESKAEQTSFDTSNHKDNQLYHKYIFAKYDTIIPNTYQTTNLFEDYLLKLDDSLFVQTVIELIYTSILKMVHQICSQCIKEPNLFQYKQYKNHYFKPTFSLICYIISQQYNEIIFDSDIYQYLNYIPSDSLLQETVDFVVNTIQDNVLSQIQIGDIFPLQVCNFKILQVQLDDIVNHYQNNIGDYCTYFEININYLVVIQFMQQIVDVFSQAVLVFQSLFDLKLVCQNAIKLFEITHIVLFFEIQQFNDIYQIFKSLNKYFDLFPNGYHYNRQKKLVCFFVFNNNFVQIEQFYSQILLHKLKMKRYSLFIIITENTLSLSPNIITHKIYQIKPKQLFKLVVRMFPQIDSAQLTIVFNNVFTQIVENDRFIELYHQLQYWIDECKNNFVETIMLIFLLYFDVEKMLPASEVCQSLMLSNKVKSIDDFKVFSKFHRLQSILLPQSLKNSFTQYFGSSASQQDDPIISLLVKSLISKKDTFNYIYMSSYFAEEDSKLKHIISAQLSAQDSLNSITIVDISQIFCQVITRSYDMEKSYNQNQFQFYLMQFQQLLFSVVQNDSPEFVILFFVLRILIMFSLGLNPLLVLPDNLYQDSTQFHFFLSPLTRAMDCEFSEGKFIDSYISMFTIQFQQFQAKLNKFLQINSLTNVIDQNNLQMFSQPFFIQSHSSCFFLDQYCLSTESKRHKVTIATIIMNTLERNCQPSLFSDNEIQNINILLAARDNSSCKVYKQLKFREEIRKISMYFIVPNNYPCYWLKGSSIVARYYYNLFSFINLNNFVQTECISSSILDQNLYQPSLVDYEISISQQLNIDHIGQCPIVFEKYFKQSGIQFAIFQPIFTYIQSALTNLNILNDKEKENVDYFVINVCNQILSVLYESLEERLIRDHEPFENVLNSQQHKLAYIQIKTQILLAQCFVSQYNFSKQTIQDIVKYLIQKVPQFQVQLIYSLVMNINSQLNTYICQQDYSIYLAMLLLIIRNSGNVIEIDKQISIIDCSLPYVKFSSQIQRVFETSSNLVMFINFDNIIDDIVASTIRSLIILRYFGIRQKQFIQLSQNAICIFQDLQKYVFVFSYRKMFSQKQKQYLCLTNLNCSRTFLFMQLNSQKNQNISPFLKAINELNHSDIPSFMASNSGTNQLIVNIDQELLKEIIHRIQVLNNIYSNFDLLWYLNKSLIKQATNDDQDVLYLDSEKEVLQKCISFITYCDKDWQQGIANIMLYSSLNDFDQAIKLTLFIILQPNFDGKSSLSSLINDDFNFDPKLILTYLKFVVLGLYDIRLEHTIKALTQRSTVFACFCNNILFSEILSGQSQIESIEIPSTLLQCKQQTQTITFLLNVNINKSYIIKSLDYFITQTNTQIQPGISKKSLVNYDISKINQQYSQDIWNVNAFFNAQQTQESHKNIKIPKLLADIYDIYSKFFDKLRQMQKEQFQLIFIEYSFQVDILTYLNYLSQHNFYNDKQPILLFNTLEYEFKEPAIISLLIDNTNKSEVLLQKFQQLLFEINIKKVKLFQPVIFIIMKPVSFFIKNNMTSAHVLDFDSYIQSKAINEIVYKLKDQVSVTQKLHLTLSAEELLLHLTFHFVVLFRKTKFNSQQNESKLKLKYLQAIIIMFALIYYNTDVIITDIFYQFVVLDFIIQIKNSVQSYQLNLDFPQVFDKISKNIIGVCAQLFQPIINGFSNSLNINSVLTDLTEVKFILTDQLSEIIPDFPSFLFHLFKSYQENVCSRIVLDNINVYSQIFHQVYIRYKAKIELKKYKYDDISFCDSFQVQDILNYSSKLQDLFNKSPFLKVTVPSQQTILRQRIFYPFPNSLNQFQYISEHLQNFIVNHKNYHKLDLQAFTPRPLATDYISFLIPQNDMEYFQYPRVGRYIPIVELENNNWEVSALVFWPILGDIIQYYKFFQEHKQNKKLIGAFTLKKPTAFTKLTDSNKESIGEPFCLTIIGMRLFRACLDSETFSICDNSECEIQDIELFYYLMVDHRSVYSELTCSEGWIPALLRAGGQTMSYVPICNMTPKSDDYWVQRCPYFGITVI